MSFAFWVLIKVKESSKKILVLVEVSELVLAFRFFCDFFGEGEGIISSIPTGSRI